MTVKAVRRGLNQETVALLAYIRRARPVNLAHGLSTQVAISKAQAELRGHNKQLWARQG